jgi:hypothetical protein
MVVAGFAVMLIVISVVTILAATVPSAVVAGTLPVTAALIAIHLERGEFLFVALAVMALGILVVFLMLAAGIFAFGFLRAIEAQLGGLSSHPLPDLPIS